MSFKDKKLIDITFFQENSQVSLCERSMVFHQELFTFQNFILTKRNVPFRLQCQSMPVENIVDQLEIQREMIWQAVAVNTASRDPKQRRHSLSSLLLLLLTENIQRVGQ